MSDRPELLPCPFCGGEAIFERDEENYFSIGCSDIECAAWTGFVGEPPIKLASCIERWNRRAPSPSDRAGE